MQYNRGVLVEWRAAMLWRSSLQWVMSSYSRTSWIIWYFPICNGQTHYAKKVACCEKEQVEIFEKEQDISSDGIEPAAEVSFRTALLPGMLPSSSLRKMHGEERLDA